MKKEKDKKKTNLDKKKTFRLGKNEEISMILV